MASKSRISSRDFKPNQKKRQLLRSLRWHWIVLGISAFAALALLLSTKDKARAEPERNALQQLPDQASGEVTATRTLELSIPKLQGATVNEDGPALPTIIPKLAADHSVPNATPSNPPPAAPSLPVTPATSAKQPKVTANTTHKTNWNTTIVEPGDNLAAIFKRQGLSSKDVFDVIHTDNESAQAMERLFPGDKIWLRISAGGTLLAVRRKLDATRTLTLSRENAADAGFQVTLTEHHPEQRIAHATAVIHESLYQAAVKAGLNEKLIMKLSGIFGWDIDFAHDIRKGDSFTLAYQQFYKNGEKIRNGDIIAAEFTNQGKRYRAVRYTDPSGRTGYYTPDGKSMRKAFLRTPVDFRRISSHFSKSRCHPILHVCRPHKGTDFAAPTGTPIHAAGDGVVAFAGRKGGYGNAVILQHSHGYSTLYGHMKRIRKGIHAGMRVVQGQIIGYVGQTGLATGPHLHYEFRIDGVPKDVLKVAMPNAKPIASRYLADFRAKALPRLAQLSVIMRTQLARNEESD